MTDLLHIVDEGAVQVGSYRIEIERDDEGALQYKIRNYTGATFHRRMRFDDFQHALTNALACLIHHLEVNYPGEDDDSVEGPGMDKEVARNVLERICENHQLPLQDILEEGAAEPLTRITTLSELHAVLGEMLAEGKDPNAPVSLRTLQREPSALGNETVADLDAIWYHPTEGVVYLDEPGV